MTLVTAKKGPFAGRRQIDFQEVASSNFVGLTNATALQAHISRHAARLGIRLHVRARLRDFDAICRMVAADVGVSFISESFARDQVKAGEVKLLNVEGVEIFRELGLVYRRDRSLPRAAQALIALIREHHKPVEHIAAASD